MVDTKNTNWLVEYNVCVCACVTVNTFCGALLLCWKESKQSPIGIDR